MQINVGSSVAEPLLFFTVPVPTFDKFGSGSGSFHILVLVSAPYLSHIKQ